MSLADNRSLTETIENQGLERKQEKGARDTTHSCNGCVGTGLQATVAVLDHIFDEHNGTKAKPF